MKNKNLSGGLFASGKPQPLTIKEAPLSKWIKEYLDDRGIYNERLNCGNIETARGSRIQLCERGTPDRLAIVCGQAIFIETKMRGQQPAPDQLRKHEQLRSSGAIVIVADDYNHFTREFSAIRAQIEEKRKGETNLYD